MQIRCIRAQHRLQTGMPAEKGDSSAVGGEKPEQEAKGVKEEDTDTDCTARAAVLRHSASTPRRLVVVRPCPARHSCHPPAPTSSH